MDRKSFIESIPATNSITKKKTNISISGIRNNKVIFINQDIIYVDDIFRVLYNHHLQKFREVKMFGVPYEKAKQVF